MHLRSKSRYIIRPRCCWTRNRKTSRARAIGLHCSGTNSRETIHVQCQFAVLVVQVTMVCISWLALNRRGKIKVGHGEQGALTQPLQSASATAAQAVPQGQKAIVLPEQKQAHKLHRVPATAVSSVSSCLDVTTTTCNVQPDPEDGE